MLEKVSQVVLLKDFYGPLLTAKQQDVLNMHYEDDWSLSEIANSMNTSRQAVYDLAKRAEGILQEYEDKLGLVAKFQRIGQNLDELRLILEDAKVDNPRLSQAVSLIEEIWGLL
ncbi:MAG: YlxM family DNA-binding protein [Syntrophomonadaceae bacterium]